MAVDFTAAPLGNGGAASKPAHGIAVVFRDLTATKLDAAGATSFARPLCRYPAFAQYNGAGDPKLAASFACAGSLR